MHLPYLREWIAASAAAALAIGIVTGCGKQAAPGNTGSPVSGAGPAAFQKYGCSRCHSIAGSGSGRAPDLTHVAADPTHTREWILDQIRNPASHNPSTRMPAYGNRIPDADLQALASYLAGLK